MIKADSKSKSKIFFYILFVLTVVFFIVTVSDYRNIIDHQKHPLIEIAKNFNDLSNVKYIAQSFALSIRKWAMAGGFIITMLILVILMSKLDSNLKNIRWFKTRELSVTHTAWLEISSTTFLLTILAFMMCTIIFSVIFTIWPVLTITPG